MLLAVRPADDAGAGRPAGEQCHGGTQPAHNRIKPSTATARCNGQAAQEVHAGAQPQEDV